MPNENQQQEPVPLNMLIPQDLADRLDVERHRRAALAGIDPARISKAEVVRTLLGERLEQIARGEA